MTPVTDPPVVAVLDTGLGQHPWFPDEAEGATAESCTGVCPGAHRRVTFGGQPVGVWKEPSRDPENTGVIIDDVNGLVDVLCGHGTFISGVIRQRCPEAVILEVPIMASDGAALEDDVVTALSLLLERHRAAKAAPGTITHGVLDVLNLSLGYYHETPDEADDTALYGPPPGLRRRGRGRRRLRRQRRHPGTLLPGRLRRARPRGSRRASAPPTPTTAASPSSRTSATGSRPTPPVREW